MKEAFLSTIFNHPQLIYFFNVGDRKIVIPKYQRWSKDNVLALLKDINDLDSSGQWFLGPIFVVKKTGDKSKKLHF